MYDVLYKRLSLSPGIPLPNPSESYWAFPPAPIQKQGAEESAALPEYADVVIIGSGITGTSFAREFLDHVNYREKEGGRRFKVVMLEARDACSGGTARNGGHITPPVFHDYPELVERYGSAAQQLIRFRLMHISNIHGVAEAEGILEYCQCREADTLDVHFDEDRFADAKNRLAMFRKDMPVEGGQFTVYEATEACENFQLSSRTCGAIHTHAGAVNAYRFVTSILSRLLSSYPKSFYLFTHTPCVSISASSNCYTLQTPKGRLMTSHVIHATNGWASHLLQPMRTKIIPARGTMSAQRPGKGLTHPGLSTPCHTSTSNMKASNRTYVFYNSGLAYDYLTQLPTPQHEMMFGGGLATGGADEFGNVNDAEYCLPIASHLSGALSVYFGEQHWGEEASGDGGEDSEENRWNRGRVKALWSGIEGVSADELPWVGRVPPKLSGRKPVGAVGGPLSSTEKGDDMSIATDSLYSQDNIVPVDLAPPGEWVAAGYTGEGMVHAWMSGKALAQMVLGREGKEDEWFPEIMRITEGRWRKAKVENLMNKFLDN